GHPALGITRNYVLLDPNFVHLLTPLSSIGVAGDFQKMDYSTPDRTSHVPFNYYQGRVFYAKTVDPRTDVAIAAFGAHYEAGTIDSHSNAGGVQLDGGYNWSQVLRSTLTAQYQRIKFEERGNRPIDVTNNAWSATFNTTYKQQISSYSF